MKIKASKVMARALQEGITDASSIEQIYCISEKPEMYARLFGSVWEHENDYNARTGKMYILKVVYKPEYYSVPQYVSTNDLIRSYKYSDKTYNGFINQVLSDYAI